MDSSEICLAVEAFAHISLDTGICFCEHEIKLVCELLMLNT